MSDLENNVQIGENIKVCSQCGAKVKENAQFCSACGRPMNIVDTKKFCTRCGTELNKDEMLCHNCGSSTSQSRDAEVMNNIAAYNNSVGNQKKLTTVVNIKNNSVYSFIAWILTSLFVCGFSAILTCDMAYTKEFYLPLLFNVVTIVGFAITTISGLLFWKNESKLRLIPVVSSAVSTICCFFAEYGTIISLRSVYWLISAMLMHIVAILFTTRVIKTKRLLLAFSISAIILSLVIPLCVKISDMLPFALSLPMFLLTFSFTSEDLKETPKKKQLIIKLITFILAFLLVLGGVGLGLYKSWVYVGDITNMNIDKAKDKYSRLYITTTYEYSETVEKDAVISQSIEKGSFVHPDKAIKLTVSKGAGVKIPEVKDLTLADAKKKLEGLGLKISITYDYSPDVAKDKVICASSYHVDEGSTVTLTVSKGPDNRVTVPNVKYFTESLAKQKLQNAGFKVNVEYVYQHCDAYYTNMTEVQSQSLTGKQNPGSTVTIKVKKPSISITRVYFHHNDIGGLNLNISFKNLSNKSIKYIIFTTEFKNSVGDDVYCNIYNSNTRHLRYTGPLDSGKSDTAYWDAVIYNWDCSQVHFYTISVTFMDGTTQEMSYSAYWY